MRRPSSLAAAAVVAVTVLAAPARDAHAWVEAHVEADDVKVVVDRSGDARVEHRITLRVAGGPLRSIDLRGVDADAAPEPDGFVVPEKEASRGSLGSAIQAVAERLPLDVKPRTDGSPAPTVLRVRFDKEKGLGRGVYVITVRYTTHLVARADPRDGPLARLTWRSPAWDDGLDSARVTFDLPAAPTEPRADDTVEVDSTTGRAPLVLTTVHRGASRDQIELVRPYAPKGEALTWGVRADVRALRPLQQQGAPVAAPGRSDLIARAERALPRTLLLVGAAALFVAYSLLVAWKSRDATQAAIERGATARPLVPLPASVRAVLAGALLVVGLFVELVVQRATIGALLILAAVALASHRSPLWPRATPRPRGRWLPMTEAAAFADPPPPANGTLDASTRAGKVLLGLSLLAVGGLVGLLFESSPYRAELIAFDTVALLAVFGTGRRAELPPDPATAPARLFRDIARRVRKAFPDGQVRLIGRVRIPDGGSVADELRLAVVPRCSERGFGALEVGVVYVNGTGAVIGLPEVLLRTQAGSPCEAKLAELARHGRASRGRSPSERAFVFSPRLPTARMTAGIVIGLVRGLLGDTSASRTATSERMRHVA